MKIYYVLIMSSCLFCFDANGEKKNRFDLKYGIQGIPKSVLEGPVKPGKKIGYGYKDHMKDRIIIKASGFINEDGKIHFKDRGYSIDGKSKKVGDVFEEIVDIEKTLKTPSYGGENAPTSVNIPNSKKLLFKRKVWFYGNYITYDKNLKDYLKLRNIRKLNSTNSSDDNKKPEREYTSEEFLRIVRNPPGRKSWAAMDGKIQNHRKQEDSREASIYLGIKFTPTRTIAQVIIDGREEYSVGQVYKAAKSSTSIIPRHTKEKTETILSQFGLRPEDLTMSFLFWNFKKELKKHSVKGRDCRVFLLESPDKKEIVQVYISEEYFFPLKACWYKNDKNLKIGKTKPPRTIIVDSFKEVNDLYTVSILDLSGPGWQTYVKFSNIKAGDFIKNPPENLFKKLNQPGTGLKAEKELKK